jgi:hypothetical protein
MGTEDTLREIAARYVWWQPPDVTLAYVNPFLCQIMTLGTADDVRTVRRVMGDQALMDALEHAPPGIMDPKSWNYWHLFFGRQPPPLPARPLP